MTSNINTSSGSEKALRWIGDLDHPFYEDERNRFVWYEASAIAFQMFLFANLALVGFMLWFGGADAMPYAVSLLIVNGAVAITMISYAHKRYAEYVPQARDFVSGRGLTYLLILLFMLGGLIRASIDQEGGLSEFGFSDIAGYAVGLGIGIGVLFALSSVVNRLRGNGADGNDEDDEF